MVTVNLTSCQAPERMEVACACVVSELNQLTPLVLFPSSSLEGGSHGSLLCEFLWVQGFSEGWGLIRIGGYYGGAVGDRIRCRSNIAWVWFQMLPSEQVCVAAS